MHRLPDPSGPSTPAKDTGAGTLTLVDDRHCRYIRALETAEAVATGSPHGSESGGVIAQLGERFNGIEEVGGSIPPGSTT